MSYANGTTHYNLPQTVGSDKRDWSDANQAFQDVDAALYQATQDTAQAELDIDALEVRMNTAEQNIADNAGDISALDGRVTTVEGTVAQHTTQIADVRRDAEDMICAYNEATATSTHAYAVGDYFIYNDVLYRATASIGIGDTIVPDTNCTTTNVTTELLHGKGVLVARSLTDGVKTWREVLNALYNNVSNWNTLKEYIIVMYGADVVTYFHMTTANLTNGTRQFTRANYKGNSDFLLNSASSTSIGVSFTGGTVTTTDDSLNVADNGYTLDLYELNTI